MTSGAERLSALELKYPRNGQVPESMFSFCKDIAFLEQLGLSGFQSAYVLTVADHIVISPLRFAKRRRTVALKARHIFKAYDIALISSSVPDEGLIARVRNGSISGLAYDYIWKTKE